MEKSNAVFLDRASLSPEDIDFSLIDSVADWQWHDRTAAADITDRIKHADIVVSNKVVIGRKVLAQCENLKLICVAATGVNNIDVPAAKDYGVPVCNVRAYATASVAQHVFSMLLALNRHLVSYHRAAVDGAWSSSEYFCYFGKPVSELQGKTMGIVGYGELGQAVASMAECIGMQVNIARRDSNDLRPGRVGLPELLEMSDVVSLHCPLTQENHHLISEDELTLMKQDAILINTARGGLVDEKALLWALAENRIGGAALDVLEQEPPIQDNPVLAYQADNLIVTPHIAWASQESRQRLVDGIAKNIQAFLNGKPENLVV